MDEREIVRRFRLVLISYAVFAASVVGGVWIDWQQTTSIHDTQKALVHDTEALAHAIADGQTYLCHQIATLNSQAPAPGPPVDCVSQQQRYQQIIRSLESR